MTRALLGAGAGGVVRAEVADDGAWSTTRTLTRPVRALAVDPLDPRVAYAGLADGGVMRSVDSGRSWSPSGLDAHPLRALATSPVTPGLVVAGTKPARVFVSHDGGESWEESHAFREIPGRSLWWTPSEWPPVAYVQSLACSATDPDVILAGIEVGGVHVTADGGRSWTTAEGAIRDCHQLAADPRDGRRFYQGGAGMRAPAAVSTDSGRSWARVRVSLRAAYGWAVAPDPRDARAVYFSSTSGPGKAHGTRDAGAGIYLARNGADPTLIAGPLNGMPYVFLADPDAPDRILTVMGNGEVWADDGDGAWRRLPVDLGPLRTAVHVA